MEAQPPLHTNYPCYANNHAPSWSPDNQRIAFTCDPSSVCIVRRDGIGLDTLAGIRGRFPAWSPAGGQIALGRGPLLVFNEDGSNVRQVIADSILVDRPAWSPDGRQIAFGGGVSQPGIWIVNADGTGLHQIYANVTTQPAQVVVMGPDGSDAHVLPSGASFGIRDVAFTH